MTLLAAAVAGCSADTSDPTGGMAPPAAAPVAAAPGTTPEQTPEQTPAATAGEFDGDAAVTAVRTYLREQALAVNAGVADPAQVPDFTATLTPAGQRWALPLLAANLGDRMPGPYPSGVLASRRIEDDRVELDLCLQDRGWQVDRTTGRPVNAAHFGTARAVVLRVGDRWLVDDVAADGGGCSAADVVEERF
ncbi:hypothetical protein [Kineococcus sp. SYSU DK003]|uniref:hypothetical protein n=1 Tax=Kineococcus sp. SYSU DK003 TaxID=3383124 RepID=UPI003D7EBD67